MFWRSGLPLRPSPQGNSWHGSQNWSSDTDFCVCVVSVSLCPKQIQGPPKYFLSTYSQEAGTRSPSHHTAPTVFWRPSASSFLTCQTTAAKVKVKLWCTPKRFQLSRCVPNYSKDRKHWNSILSCSSVREHLKNRNLGVNVVSFFFPSKNYLYAQNWTFPIFFHVFCWYSHTLLQLEILRNKLCIQTIIFQAF